MVDHSIGTCEYHEQVRIRMSEMDRDSGIMGGEIKHIAGEVKAMKDDILTIRNSLDILSGTIQHWAIIMSCIGSIFGIVMTFHEPILKALGAK